MDSIDHFECAELRKIAQTYPAIDNHAHPLLREQHRDALPFEGIISEAAGEALHKDAIQTLACYRATSELGALFKMHSASWDDIKDRRATMDYHDLCTTCMDPSGIQCILIDDGLGAKELVEAITWHDQFTRSPTRRIVRIERVAEELLKEILEPHHSDILDDTKLLELLRRFTRQLIGSLTSCAEDPLVVAFKSVVCYRTGLDISTEDTSDDLRHSFTGVLHMYKETGSIRLSHKALNDHVVRLTLDIASQHNMPVQFHTGLGDNDITLIRSSPSYMQPIIKAYPKATFILLHSSYPYTREAGYLTAVYSNTFLDFGEVFPFVSGQGQRSIIRQVLELSPINKILWSTDGHWWPESYYLGTIQARQALYEVLRAIVHSGELTEARAITIVKNALFHNANKVYNLNLEPLHDVA